MDEKRNELHTGLRTIAKGLADLRDSAIRYLREGVHTDVLHHDTETDKTRACRILGVPVNASVSQIRECTEPLLPALAGAVVGGDVLESL